MKHVYLIPGGSLLLLLLPMFITVLLLNVSNGKHLRRSSQIKKPKISHLCVFGCGAYVYLPNEVCTNKLTLHSELMIFIGYEDNGYRFIRHTQNNIIFCSIQAIFDKRNFPKCPSSYPRERRPPSELTVVSTWTLWCR